jgi:hypothetical protein
MSTVFFFAVSAAIGLLLVLLLWLVALLEETSPQ